jgi:hypothetical protein
MEKKPCYFVVARFFGFSFATPLRYAGGPLVCAIGSLKTGEAQTGMYFQAALGLRRWMFLN